MNILASFSLGLLFFNTGLNHHSPQNKTCHAHDWSRRPWLLK
jgi:hypothetical protein